MKLKNVIWGLLITVCLAIVGCDRGKAERPVWYGDPGAQVERLHFAVAEWTEMLGRYRYVFERYCIGWGMEYHSHLNEQNWMTEDGETDECRFPGTELPHIVARSVGGTWISSITYHFDTMDAAKAADLVGMLNRTTHGEPDNYVANKNGGNTWRGHYSSPTTLGARVDYTITFDPVGTIHID